MAEEKKKPAPKKKEAKPEVAGAAPDEKAVSQPAEKAASKPAEEKSPKKAAPGGEAPAAETPKPADAPVIPVAPRSVAKRSAKA